MTAPALHDLAERVGELTPLDPIGRTIGKTVRNLVPPGPVKDALSGTWLGHALHPLLTDLPIGTWTSATMLDLVGGEDAAGAADTLITIGIVVSLPTLWTGWTEYGDSEVGDPRVRRIGIVHAASNGTALACYIASLGARRRGRRGRGTVLGLAGAAALGVGGFFGGHLSYAKGVGVDVTAFEHGPGDWTAVGSASELGDGALHKVRADGVDVLVVRHDGELRALSNTCTHRGGPLDQGQLIDGCVECPWHGSRFALRDGSVERGPATAPEPVYEVRERDGAIEVRAATD
jgi:nitrite reductase/ring-hydroxylating ferredoxin subunit/uncharacterized membrane protein